MSDRRLFEEIKNLATEQRNPRSEDIDSAGTLEILRIISAEDALVPEAVQKEIPYIAQAVDIIVEAFRKGGSLVYIGAGTSGRLGILDATECPPTYGTPPDMVRGIIAGGREAVFRSQEGAEDVEEHGRRDLEADGVTAADVVCGIAASRRTPYVVGAIRHARSIGCRTLFLTCNPRSEFDLAVDVAICPVVGPEVIMGSTRMKAGTAQKLVLNMLTTASMVRLGKVYHNMMIDLQMTSKKLVERSKRVVMMVTGLDYEGAAAILDQANGHVKTALVMALGNVSAGEARERLERSGGFVRGAIE